MDAIAILCTVPDQETATRLAKGLVDKKLAACVNVINGVVSVYRWEGATHEDRELQLIIKTRADHFDAIEAYLSKAHPYDVPEVIALPIARGSKPYLAWLAAQTQSE